MQTPYQTIDKLYKQREEIVKETTKYYEKYSPITAPAPSNEEYLKVMSNHYEYHVITEQINALWKRIESKKFHFRKLFRKN